MSGLMKGINTKTFFMIFVLTALLLGMVLPAVGLLPCYCEPGDTICGVGEVCIEGGMNCLVSPDYGTGVCMYECSGICRSSCLPGENISAGGCEFNEDCCVGGGSPGTYFCIGTAPANANLCSGDDQGLTQNTNIALVDACSTPQGSVPKCEYVCNSGWIYNSTTQSCQQTNCVGTPPAFHSKCRGDFSGVTQSTSITLVDACSQPDGSAPKCEVTCNEPFYVKQGNQCVRSGPDPRPYGVPFCAKAKSEIECHNINKYGGVGVLCKWCPKPNPDQGSDV